MKKVEQEGLLSELHSLQGHLWENFITRDKFALNAAHDTLPTMLTCTYGARKIRVCVLYALKISSMLWRLSKSCACAQDCSRIEKIQ